MPVSVTSDYALEHDNKILEIMTDSLGLPKPLSPQVTQQIMLPLSSCGLGVLSARNSCATAYIAASHSVLSSHLESMQLTGTTVTPIASSASYLQTVDEAINDWKLTNITIASSIAVAPHYIEPVVSDIIPETAQDIVTYYSTRENLFPIQHTLTQRTSKNIYLALVQWAAGIEDIDVRQHHQSRLTSIYGKDSHRWLTLLPMHPLLRLHDECMKWNVKLRLGEHPGNLTDSPNCPKCLEPNALAKDP